MWEAAPPKACCVWRGLVVGFAGRTPCFLLGSIGCGGQKGCELCVCVFWAAPVVGARVLSKAWGLLLA